MASGSNPRNDDNHHLQKEKVFSWTLNVTVLNAKTQNSMDYFTESDLYVVLSLPTARATPYRTKTVSNNNNPEWNETFTFRVPVQTKNVLEIQVYDEDLRYDELMSTVQLDIGTLTVGNKETQTFSINPQEEKDELVMEFELTESKNHDEYVSSDILAHKEKIFFWTLNITVLNAKTQKSMDYFSDSDLYVVLSLPTARATPYRTKTVSNNNNPEWNETFTFRVPVQTKNVLEIQVYDDNGMMFDKLMSTVRLDIATLTVGKKKTKTFRINPQEEKDELVMEFELIESKENHHEYMSNGILVAAPLTVLDVGVDQLLTLEDHVVNKAVKVIGAYEDTKTLTLKESGSQKLRFYINRDLETELRLAPNGGEKKDDAAASAVTMETCTHLQNLPASYKGKISLPLGKGAVDLDLKTKEQFKKVPTVRLAFDTPPQEKEFLKKRKAVVAEALQKLLGFSSALKEDEVPSIAVVGSGGGTRAMVGLLGGLKALKDMGVLDTVSYITGVSGSTWTMSSVYQDNNWSHQDMDGFINAQKKQNAKGTSSMLSFENMNYYYKEISKKEEDGYLSSFTDMAGLMFEQLIFGKKVSSTLSEQQQAVSEGQNPLPIYTAVNMKEQVQGTETSAEWCEFTPYEVGFPKYGAFVPTEDFGSHYFLGHRLKKLPELRLPYLIGIWSSAFAINLTEVWNTVTGMPPSWMSPGRGISPVETDANHSLLDTTVCNPVTKIAGILNNFFRIRVGVNTMFNYMRGLFLHRTYNKNNNFVTWKDTHPDAYPNQLTPHDSTLHLVDSGHAINISCVPILKPGRDVDVIIVLSYSWEPGHHLEVIRLTAQYCKDHHIPFPQANYCSLEKEPEKEVYIFKDKLNPKAPIVIHFPLLNVTYKDFKQPGVKRETEEEKKAGNVDVKSDDSPYHTTSLTYSDQDYDALVDLAYYNVINNKESVLNVIKEVLHTKTNQDQPRPTQANPAQPNDEHAEGVIPSK